jgi:lysyl-tRNA synthetase class 2
MTVETNIHRESRLVKLKDLQEKGYNPYPYCFKPNAYALDLQEKYKDLEAGTDTEDRVTIAGRAMAVRNSGMFIDVKDNSGKIQAFCHKNHLSEEDLDRLKDLDVGDIVGISGYVRRTPRGELSVAAEKFDIISKSYPFLICNQKNIFLKRWIFLDRFTCEHLLLHLCKCNVLCKYYMK